MSFDGFPEAALDFYDDLEIDNSKFFWEQHKETYRTAVAEPMSALAEELADEFGTAKLFRPYRDVRFSKDKTPYKTHQGAFVAVAPATGYYIQIGAPGVRVGAGFYEATPARLAELRKAIDHDRHGPELEKLVRRLTRAGWEIGGDRLKTAPRGYDVDHPRIDLLRHKSLFAGRDYGFDEVIHTPALVDRVRKDWRATTPLVEWIARHAAT
ncbi:MULTISPECIES: DUF2461 domain-containing protein [Gordonia]|uniref:DUF2461 domain-containing protein n=1 Tax=Gordonia amicalis TaxID=89053 RepID=A0AAE4UAD0_9ACTN|nr:MULTISPECIES: DUF2461 domain-containing protein [Gordonia]ATD71319.1 TIGR02453 family protein [Gordonia sp. 1D]KAF0968261.1 hypothetical protein BPODLACK_03202 [Gordonia sp. YY1]MCR8899334.1 DUF2461 domain-containing protein [Gordonia sp. GONU]MCZ0912660.1 DUF2461 domain-containing protein [Gordonia amicalis]MCZ4580608.1 DUF2461 domain-containing protein [Gordonia amicalis]